MSQTKCVGFHSENFDEVCAHELPNGWCAFFKVFCDMKKPNKTEVLRMDFSKLEARG